MPLQKLRLNRADAYQAKVAASLLCEMLACHAQGKPHPRGYRYLGSEQGLPGWDDFVVELDGGARIYHQVKRQESEFCTRVVDRKPDQNGNQVPLSDLDKVFAAIALVSEDFRQTDRLRLDLVSSQVRVKRTLYAKDLRDLATECNKPGVVAARLQNLTQEQRYQDLYTWLTSWCDYRDWDHIHAVFSKLEVNTMEDESQLKAGAVSHLGSSWSEPDLLFGDIVRLVQNEASYAGFLDASILWRRFHSRFDRSLPRWTRYTQARINEPWLVNGIQHVSTDDVEPANSVVERTWDAGSQSHLEIGTSPPLHLATDPLPFALSRLALHLPHNSTARALQAAAWRSSMAAAVGHTLGLASTHEPANVPFLPVAALDEVPGSRSCESVPEGDLEAEALQQAMDRKTWGRVMETVERLLGRDVSDGGLRGDLRARWTSWIGGMDDAAKRDLMVGLLHAEAEGAKVQGLLRVGPRTVELMADGIMLRLLVEAAAGGRGTWDSLGSGLTVRSLALVTWAGPAGSATGAYRLDETLSSDLLKPLAQQPRGFVRPSDEKCTVLVMSGVACSPTDWLEPSLADDAPASHNLAADERRVIVTNDSVLRRELRETGRTEVFGRRLRERLDMHTRTRDHASTALDDLVAENCHAS